MPGANVITSLFNALRGSDTIGGKVYTPYPITAGGMCAGIALPHDNNIAAGAWGAWTTMMLAAASPAVEFWVCGYQILVSGAAGVQPHAVQIGSGLIATPPTVIFEGINGANRAAAADDSTNVSPVIAQYPIYQPAATPISGRSAVTAKAAATNITTAVLLAVGY